MKSNFEEFQSIKIDLSSWPSFGTYWDKGSSRYYVQLSPGEQKVREIVSSYLQIDTNYKKKETFYIYLETQKGGKNIFK